MLTFERLSYRNFFSAGDKPIEIQLDKSPTSLIVGDNGSGKSTIIEGLVFALFGKPYRKVNKGQIVNSVNGKNCLVELEFSRGQDEYHVRRGISPSVFEVHKNGSLLNKDAQVRDYQNRFELEHLRMNYRSFCQIVIIGSNLYVPFMKLPAGQRREVIEDLLDLKVLAHMSDRCKARLKVFEERKTKAHRDVFMLGIEIDGDKKRLDELMKKDESALRTISNDIADTKRTISELTEVKCKQESALRIISDKIKLKRDKIDAKERSLESDIRVLDSQITDLSARFKFFQDNTKCPTCESVMTDEHRQRHEEEIRDEILLREDEHKRKSVDHHDVQRSKAGIEKISKKYTSEERRHSQTLSEISMHESKLLDDQRRLKEIRESLDSLVDIENDITNKERRRRELEKRYSVIEKAVDYHKETLNILKDDGVKARIISHYIPILNDRINHYLDALDFFAKFHLDESFNETIKARHRDEFSYDSFSEGEKQRISLALLFAWRDLARMKNSLSTNLLIMDETFDSSMDDDGVENLMQIFHFLNPGTNVHVISHKKDLLDDQFGRTLTFRKEGNFSSVSER